MASLFSSFYAFHKIAFWKSGLFCILILIIPPADLYAIHAVIKDKEPVPRSYGPISLEMPMAVFLRISEAKAVAPAIGQFDDEHRFEFVPPTDSKGVENLILDFYQDTLFRIEVNYKPVKRESSTLAALIETWSQRYGRPRVKSLQETHLFFWDDGGTRMILQIDEMEKESSYSVTYIDDDLFHQISRERVQRETAGRAQYGR